MCNVSFFPSASSWKKTCPTTPFVEGVEAERNKRLTPSEPTTTSRRSEPIIASATGDRKFLERNFKSPAAIADDTTEVAGTFIEGVANLPPFCVCC